MTDKTEKHLASYEYEGDLLRVERHFAPEPAVSERLRSFLKGRGLCEAEPAAAPHGDAAGKTAAESREGRA